MPSASQLWAYVVSRHPAGLLHRGRIGGGLVFGYKAAAWDHSDGGPDFAPSGELVRTPARAGHLDDTAKGFLAEARDCYRRMDLRNQWVVNQGAQVMLLTWLGDSANEAIACLLIRRGFNASPSRPGVEVLMGRHTTAEILDALSDAAVDEPPPLDMLLTDVQNLQREKWDWMLPDGLLRKAYASHYLDLDEALAWVKTLALGDRFCAVPLNQL